ncbi:MAG TPA: glycoside hydrolase family 2 TIM barrel-domain containing protein [Tepidisphaeraceae bacterium]|nr:glycoside hydrolase family 2 TIM barrel-domain containing protein [Tepidisphaeraceae bacterium]
MSLKDVAAVQNNKEVMTPQAQAIYEADPFRTAVYHMGVAVGRKRDLTGQRWDVPALLLIDGSTLKPEGNRLLIHGYDYDLYGELLGNVEMRRPTLEDALVPYAYSLPDGPTGTKTILALRPRVPGPHQVTADIEVQDYLGTTLRRESRKIDVVSGTDDTTFELPQQSGNEYKAIVTYSRGEEKLKPYWVYFQPRLTQSDGRSSYSLEGADWTLEHLPIGKRDGLPAKGNDVRPMYVPGPVRNTWEWYLWDKVHEMALRKTFTLPSQVKGDRLLLHLGDVRHTAEVFVNGKSVGRVNFNQVPADLDVTDAVKREGENEIVIVLGDAKTAADAMGLTTANKSFAAGAFRRVMMLGTVRIDAVPEVRVVRTEVDTSVTEGKLTVTTTVENRSTSPVDAEVAAKVVLKDQSIATLPPATVSVGPGGMSKVVTSVPMTDAQLWSPWSPTLYGLKTQLSVGGEVADRATDRFGFREIGIRGDQILLNGKVFHMIGHEQDADRPWSAWPMLDYHREVQHVREARDMGYTYLRRNKMEQPLHDLHDEVGITTSLFYGPWDNHQGDVSVDKETEDAYSAEAIAHIPTIKNHPSVVKLNYGNEVLGGGNVSDKLAESLFTVVQRIKAADPTRLTFTQGSYDLNGRTETYSSHYGDHAFFGKLTDEVPAELRERAPRRFGESKWNRKKPVNIDEFSWILPRGGYAWAGEPSMKLTPFREPSYRPDRLHDIYPIIGKREREFHHYRRGGASAFAAFAPRYITNRNIAPVLAIFFEENTRFWADQPILRTVDVFNDSGADATIQVEVSLTVDGQTSKVWSQDVALEHGGHKAVEMSLPARNVNGTTEVRADLVSRINGVERSRRTQRWTLFPRNWSAQPPAGQLAIGLFDPHGSAKGLLEAINVKPTVTLTNVSELSERKLDVLLIGEDMTKADVGAAPDAIREWVKAGGRAVVLRQKDPSVVLPLPLNLKDDHRSGAFETFLIAVGQPVVAGLLPEDFFYWGRNGLVTGVTYDPPKLGTVRVLSGKLPTNVSLLEAFYGSGKFVITTLELTPTKVAEEPAAARVLANALFDRGVSSLPAGAGTAPPAEAKTLVISGSADGARAKALKETLRLQADYLVNTGPESLEPYGTVVVTDYDAADGPVPPEALARPLRAWVERGGRLLVHSVTPNLQRWLEQALDVRLKRESIVAVRAYKIAHDPVLAGISDGDIAWRGHSGEWPFVNHDPTDHDIIREAVVPEGGKRLTYPAVLAVKDVGKGRLVIDQSRWNEVTNKAGQEWSNDSRLIAARYQAALLTNLGAHFVYPKLGGDSFVGLKFEPLDLTVALTRARTDEKPGDGKGWIDIGERFDLRRLLPGLQRIANVPFQIVDESKSDGGNGVVMLRSAEQFKDLPTQSAVIPVNEKAKDIFFLHTTAYAGSPKGTAAWEYEIRYEGHRKLIMGQDFSTVTATVPVESEVHVGDWLGVAPIPTALTLPNFPGGGSAHLYLQRWTNPRPDTLIESIVIRSKLAKEVPIVFGITLASEAENLVVGDFSETPPFRVKMKQFTVLDKQGDLPAGWSTNAWHDSTTSEVIGGPEPTTGVEAVSLRNVDGRPSVQFYLAADRVKLEAGKTYTIAFRYLTAANAAGIFRVAFKGATVESEIPPNSEIALNTTAGAWKQFVGQVKVLEGTGALELNFQNRAAGPDDVLYLSQVTVTGEETVEAATSR